MGVFYGPKPIITDGLILCLDAANPKSYSGSGTTWTDLTGNGHNGTIDGATFNTNGLLYFDGTNDEVEITDTWNGSTAGGLKTHTLLNGNNNYSFNLWFQTSTFPTSTGYSTSPIIFKAGRRSVYILHGDSTAVDKLGFHGNWASGGWSKRVESNTLSLNTWYNICFTYNTSNGFVCYQNGSSVDTNSSTIGPQTNYMSNSYIGRLADSENFTSQRYWNGKMAFFSIYEKTLTSLEVAQNYDALRGRYGTPPPPPIQSGQVVFVTSGTYSWEVPESIFSICAVCVGGGGGSSSGFSSNIKGAGGGGGALSYKNNISVTPGETLTIIVGAAGAGASAGQFSNGGNAGSTSIKRSTTTLLIAYGGAGGTYNGSGGSGGSTWGSADGGGNGGNGGTPTNDWDGVGCGGGGAGGYSGNGGNGGYGVFDPPSDFPSNGSGGSGGAGGGGGPHYSSTQDNGGGGVGIIKTGSNGSGGSANSPGTGGSSGDAGNSTDGTGGNYGGGAGGAGGSSAGSNGAGGAVRIIFGDPFTDTRTYPNTSDNA
jgi:hypothetical protein